MPFLEVRTCISWFCLSRVRIEYHMTNDAILVTFNITLYWQCGNTYRNLKNPEAFILCLVIVEFKPFLLLANKKYIYT